MSILNEIENTNGDNSNHIQDKGDPTQEYTAENPPTFPPTLPPKAPVTGEYPIPRRASKVNHDTDEPGPRRRVSRPSLTQLARFGSQLSRVARGEQSGGDGLIIWQESSSLKPPRHYTAIPARRAQSAVDLPRKVVSHHSYVAVHADHHDDEDHEDHHGDDDDEEEDDDDILLSSSDEYEDFSDDSENGMLFFQPRNIEQQWNEDDGDDVGDPNALDRGRQRQRKRLISQLVRSAKLDRERRHQAKVVTRNRDPELDQKLALGAFKTGFNRLIELFRDSKGEKTTNDQLSPIHQRVRQRDDQNPLWVWDSVLALYFLTGIFG